MICSKKSGSMIHDGPIFHHYISAAERKETVTTISEIGGTNIPKSIQYALKLACNDDNDTNNGKIKFQKLFRKSKNNNSMKNNDEDSVKTSCDLIMELKDDKSLLNINLRKEMEKDKNVGIGLYRLLLELSISIHTPSATRKRIISYLKKNMDKKDEVELEVLYSIIMDSNVYVDVDESSNKSDMWMDGLVSLKEWGMEYPSSCYNGIISYLIVTGKRMLENNNSNGGGCWSIDRAKDLATITKRIMDVLLLLPNDITNTNNDNVMLDDGLLYKLSEEVLEPLLIQTTTTGESVNALGVTTAQIVYCKLLQLKSKESKENFLLTSVQHWTITTATTTTISPFAKLAWIKGVLVTIPQHYLTTTHGTNDAVLWNNIQSFILHHSRYANNDSATGYSALKGLEILLSSTATNITTVHDQQQHKLSFCKDVIEIIFHSWECPTKNRSISCILPKLFHRCIQIITSDTKSSSSNHDDDNDVIRYSILPRILSQPSYRKGKYQALEVVLPHVGAHALLSSSNTNNNNNFLLLHSLVNNLGLKENLPIANVMADLWKHILICHREEEGYNIIPSLITTNNKKKRKKTDTDNDQSLVQQQHQQPILPKEWIETYVIPPIHKSIVSSSERIRSSISSFCLPLLKDIAGNNHVESAQIFTMLLQSIMKITTNNDYSNHSSTGATTSMIQLWAMLEIIRHAKLLSITSPTFHKTLHTYLSPKTYQASLLHSSSSIRLVAFSIMDYYYYSSSLTLNNNLSLQVHTWKYALPYAMKSGDKTYVSKLVSLLMSLLTLLNAHLLIEERQGQVANVDAAESIISHEKEEHMILQLLPEHTLLCQFVSHFLIPKLIINHGSYPGTVYEKELFILLLLQRLLQFFPSTTLHNTNTNNERKKIKRIPPKVTLFRKLCHDYIQHTSLRGCCALRDSIVTTLLFSMWDKTRLAAYQIILMLDHHVNHHGNPFSSSSNKSIANSITTTTTTKTTNWRRVLCRGIYLSSSPRQREADTGANILAIYHKLLFLQFDYNFLETDLLPLIRDRLAQMELTLGVLAHHNNTPDNSKTDSISKDCSMPLAHGLIHCMQLIVEQQKLYPTIIFNDNNSVYETMLHLCCRSMEISLSIVADVDHDEYDEYNNIDPIQTNNDTRDFQKRHQIHKSKSNVPLNVNAGTIGANAIFASISPYSEEDRLNRAALQRVVVGSWLLIKEACAALSTILSNIPPSSLSASMVSKCGSLLLSTLISLKHQGAAFSAHKSFQLLCSSCYPQKNHNINNGEEKHLKRFPLEWTMILLREISYGSTTYDVVEKKSSVRDSTLRRSTGYAFGFLAIVRSEIFSSASSGLPKSIFHMVMAHLIRLSLPCHSNMKTKLKKLGEDQKNAEETLVYRRYLASSTPLYIPDDEYEWKSRVHALNILRLAIMDAPLAKEIHTFAGDAIFSSLLGYNDFDSWAVRNSSTMVFSSVMLRVIDADKNAHLNSSSSGITESIVAYSESTGSSAVTAKELFRKYPFLSPFLVSSLEVDHNNKEEENITDPSLIYAILLLLARLQPASCSSVDVGANDVIIPLIKPLLNCLTHSYHKVRVMASRALAALCTDEDDDVNNESSSSSRTVLLHYCLFVLLRSKVKNWNSVHGALLAIQSLIRSAISQSAKLLSLEIWNELLLTIRHYSSWCDWTYACPPTCVAVALEIYVECQSFEKRHRIEGENECDRNNDFMPVDKMALNIVSSVEKLKNKSIELIGLSYLGAVAAKISCSCCFSDLRLRFSNRNDSDQIPRDSLFRVQALFKSSSFDVRISSIKTFKKLLFVQVDQNHSRNNILLLSQICQMLLSSLRLELWKLNEENCLRHHAPTLRRLSRCLIDCICCIQNIAYKYDYSESKSQRVEVLAAIRDNWALFLELKRIGGSKPEDDTTLEGNALELMAFSLSVHLDSKSDNKEECDINKDDDDKLLNMLQQFVDAIKQSTNPTNEWKIRYSAALAIPCSGVLNLLRNRDDNFSKTSMNTSSSVQSILHAFCLDLYIELLKLLQDGDEDVREAAGKVVSKAIDTVEEEGDCTYFYSVASVPLLALEKAYADICTKVYFPDKSKFIKALADQLLSYCENLKEDLKFAFEEITANGMILSNEESNMDDNKSFYSTKLMNLSTKRKVFEDENPNPFEEKLVIMQLNIATVVRLHETNYKENYGYESFQQLLYQCQSILQFLVDAYYIKKNSDNQYTLHQNVLHDLTRCQSIFPGMFGIILGSACAFAIGYYEDNNARLSVSQIISNASTLISYGTNFFHPHIITALQVLVKAASFSCKEDKSEASTYEDILGSCFLLPTFLKN